MLPEFADVMCFQALLMPCDSGEMLYGQTLFCARYCVLWGDS